MAGHPGIAEFALLETEPMTPALHRYGRLSIVVPNGTGPRPPDLDDETLHSLTETERLGLEALRVRNSPAATSSSAP